MDQLLDNIALGLLVFNIIFVIYIISSIYKYSVKRHYIYTSLLFIPLFLGIFSSLLLGAGLIYPYLNQQIEQKNIGYIKNKKIDRGVVYIQTDKKYSIILNQTDSCPPDDLDEHDEIKLIDFLHGNQKVKFPTRDITKSSVCTFINIDKNN